MSDNLGAWLASVAIAVMVAVLVYRSGGPEAAGWFFVGALTASALDRLCRREKP